MKTPGMLALATLIFGLGGIITVPATAGISPYVRMEYGGTQMRLTDGNRQIKRAEASFQSAGLPAKFQTVGPGSGPGGSVGCGCSAVSGWVRPTPTSARCATTASRFRASCSTPTTWIFG